MAAPVTKRAWSLQRKAANGAEVLGSTDGAHRRRRGGAGQVAAVERAQPVGVVRSRLQRVHGDAVAGHLERERLQEAGRAGPGRVGQDEAADGLAHRDRGDGHDPPPALRLHRRDGGLAQGHHREQVQLERGQVGGEVGGREGARRGTAGVGDEDVDATEPLGRLGSRTPWRPRASTRRPRTATTRRRRGPAVRPAPAAAAEMRSSSRPQIATRTPSAASAAAVARPSPLDAPATAARRPLIPRSTPVTLPGYRPADGAEPDRPGRLRLPPARHRLRRVELGVRRTGAAAWWSTRSTTCRGPSG